MAEILLHLDVCFFVICILAFWMSWQLWGNIYKYPEIYSILPRKMPEVSLKSSKIIWMCCLTSVFSPSPRVSPWSAWFNFRCLSVWNCWISVSVIFCSWWKIVANRTAFVANNATRSHPNWTGWWLSHPSEKYDRSGGSFSRRNGVKIENMWNHLT